MIVHVRRSCLNLTMTPNRSRERDGAVAFPHAVCVERHSRVCLPVENEFVEDGGKWGFVLDTDKELARHGLSTRERMPQTSAAWNVNLIDAADEGPCCEASSASTTYATVTTYLVSDMAGSAGVSKSSHSGLESVYTITRCWRYEALWHRPETDIAHCVAPFRDNLLRTIEPYFVAGEYPLDQQHGFSGSTAWHRPVSWPTCCQGR